MHRVHYSQVNVYSVYNAQVNALQEQQHVLEEDLARVRKSGKEINAKLQA